MRLQLGLKLIHLRAGSIALIAINMLALPAAQSAIVNCSAIFDISSTPKLGRTVQRNLPPGFKLFIWRYNSGIKDSSGKSSFDNAQISQLNYEPESGTYFPVRSESVQQNRLAESPESRHRRLDGGILSLVPNPVEAELQSGSKGNGIFERNQSLTFELYEKTGYLTPEASALQKAIARDKLVPEQVTIAEATEEVDTKRLRAEFGKVPPHARLEANSKAWIDYRSQFAGFKKPRNLLYDLKVGASWIIAGQVGGKPYPLALEASELQNPIDRSRFKYVFEIGRAGQERNYGFEETFRANLFQAVNEVLAAGGKLEDAYLFAHAMDQKRAIVFRRKYFAKEYSGYVDPKLKDEIVVMMPLLKVLDSFDLAGFSNELHRIREDIPSTRSLSSHGIYQWILDSRRLANQKLQVKLKGQGTVTLNLRDFSYLRTALYEREKNLSVLSRDDQALFARTLGDSTPPMEYRDNISVELERNSNSATGQMARTSGIRRPHPQYQNEGLQSLHEFLRSQNVIEVFPETTKGPLSRQNAEDILLGVYDYYIALLKSRRIPDPHAFLQVQGVRFALTANGASFDRPLNGPEPKGYWYVHRPSVSYVTQGSFLHGFGMVQRTREVRWESWSYDTHQLAELRKTRREANQPLARVRQSETQPEHILQDPRLLEP